jgi:hypothetical protein
MGKGADRVKDGTPEHVLRRVSGEIDTLRTELGSLVGELDRRRHEAFDLRLQATRHPVALALTASALALVVGGLIAAAVHSSREHRRPSVRARETRRALVRLFDHPHRVAAEPGIGRKVVAALAIAIATTLAKRLVTRAVPVERSRPRVAAAAHAAS